MSSVVFVVAGIVLAGLTAWVVRVCRPDEAGKRLRYLESDFAETTFILLAMFSFIIGVALVMQGILGGETQ